MFGRSDVRMFGRLFARSDGRKFPTLFYKTSFPSGPMPKKAKKTLCVMVILILILIVKGLLTLEGAGTSP